MMMLQDQVYGDFEIIEPVLIELINSPPVQRLKGISQQGMPREYYYKDGFSRFDHSVGVFLLLRKLGADLYEQAAGLLHDISHTAFSHVIDLVIGDPTKEDYQDNTYLEVLKKSEIPAILIKHNLNAEKITDLSIFTLLEQESPSLCADRIDYSLREMVSLGYPKKARQIVDDLSVADRHIVFREKEVAEEFGKSYAYLQREHWAGNESKVRYHILAEILKMALDKNILSLNDFQKTDNEIITLLIGNGDQEITEKLKKLKNGLVIKESNVKEGIKVKKKFRYVDPEVLVNGQVKSLSSISEGYQDLISQEIEHSRKVIALSF